MKRGVQIPAEIDSIKRMEVFSIVSERLKRFTQYQANWDSYGASAPRSTIISFAKDFFLNVCFLQWTYKEKMSSPFVVPTQNGGIQFEWDFGVVSLEIEIPEVGEFRYYRSDGETEDEGSCNRWQAVRLIRWANEQRSAVPWDDR